MKKYLILLFLQYLFITVYSQDKSVQLVKFESSECIEEDHLYNIQNRIVSIENIESLTIIEIAVRANCCLGDVGKIEYSLDTLKLYYTGKGSPVVDKHGDTVDYIITICDCDCCFHFRYYLKGLDNKQYIVFASNKVLEQSEHRYLIKPVKFDVQENGDTINYLDMYGFKQGLHILRGQNGEIISKMTYIDDRAIEGISIRKYYDSGEVRFDILKKNGEYVQEIEYYKNGAIKKDCQISELFDENKKCKEYDVNGQLIKN